MPPSGVETFNAQVTDGVFAADPKQEGEALFFEATGLTGILDDDVAALEQTVRRRVLRYLARHNYLDEAAAEDMLSWEHSGFSLDAGTRIEAWDRFGLERLGRYAAKPALAVTRLARLDEETLIYRLPRPAHDGSTHVTLTPLQLIDRLTHRVPPPRKNTLHYCGVFSAAAKLRKAVVASTGPAAAMQLQLEEAARRMGLDPERETGGGAPDDGSAASDNGTAETSEPETAKPKRRLSAYLWAMLVARVLGALPLLCPVCSSPMKVKSVVTDRDEVRRILEHSASQPSRRGSRLPAVRRKATSSSIRPSACPRTTSDPISTRRQPRPSARTRGGLSRRSDSEGGPGRRGVCVPQLKSGAWWARISGAGRVPCARGCPLAGDCATRYARKGRHAAYG